MPGDFQINAPPPPPTLPRAIWRSVLEHVISHQLSWLKSLSLSGLSTAGILFGQGEPLCLSEHSTGKLTPAWLRQGTGRPGGGTDKGRMQPQRASGVRFVSQAQCFISSFSLSPLVPLASLLFQLAKRLSTCPWAHLPLQLTTKYESYMNLKGLF